MPNKIILILVYFFLMQRNSFAYLDPGTGSIILQAILGFIAAAGASVVLYWTKFKELLSKIFKSKNKKSE
tara:strand:+ start:216 stop:425 length:210 start_codon:yes stop_codon:yes gene_type:complete